MLDNKREQTAVEGQRKKPTAEMEQAPVDS